MSSFSFGSALPHAQPLPAQPAAAVPNATTFTFGSGCSPPEPQAPQRLSPFSFGISATPVPAAPPVASTPTPASVETKAEPPASPKKPAKMATKVAVSVVADEAEGNVTFPSRENAVYRYRLTVRADTVQIWIEDKKTKQQWQSSELELYEFVPLDRVIPMATLKDYIECFKSCLAADNNDDAKNGAFQRDLVQLEKNNELQLEFTLKIQIFATVLTPVYTFTLYPVELDPVDVLSAKIRDQEEEIASLRAELGELKLKSTPAGTAASAMKPSSPVYLRAETIKSVSMNQNLVWKMSDVGSGRALFQIEESGSIKFLREGLYVVQVVVCHTNTYDLDSFNRGTQYDAYKLQKNDVALVTCMDSDKKGSFQSSPLHHILPMAKNETLSVVYKGTGQAQSGSYIIIYRVN